MNVKLKRANINDAESIWHMQIDSFAELLEKYKDYDTNPANEPLQKIKDELNDSSTYFYLINMNNKPVGAIRVVLMENGAEKRISPLFILPEYHNMGIAQKAIVEAEKIHGKENWSLETMQQEKKNCYLYEKMGYKKTGKSEIINDRFTLILYYK